MRCDDGVLTSVVEDAVQQQYSQVYGRIIGCTSVLIVECRTLLVYCHCRHLKYQTISRTLGMRMSMRLTSDLLTLWIKVKSFEEHP
jgi:hypothetical protein